MDFELAKEYMEHYKWKIDWEAELARWQVEHLKWKVELYRLQVLAYRTSLLKYNNDKSSGP